MNIYIDESGIFRNPANKDNIASCVGALAIPSSQRKNIVRDFKQLKSAWNVGKGEVKGGQLGEVQISAVIQLLKQYEVMLDLVLIDLGLLSDADITAFKLMSADGITANLTSKHQPQLVAQLSELKQAFLNMPNNLFVQAVMLASLIPDLVQSMITYYSRRMPEEIGRFRWIVDAKDKFVTDYEKSLSTVIYPFIESCTRKIRFYYLHDGDYSHFHKNMDTDRPLSEVALNRPEFDDGEFMTGSVNKILGGGLKFEDSKSNFCLQLIDILANAARRALNGNLDKSGWGEMGALMVNGPTSPVRQIVLDKNPAEPSLMPKQNPFVGVFDQLRRNARPMFL